MQYALAELCDPRVLEFADEITAIRRDFHAHPELGLEEVRTASIIAAKLREWGVDEVVEKVGITGVVGVIHGNQPGDHAIGLRADFDALPLVEESGVEWSSQTPGLHHGCGHDGHAATLLGVAKFLAENRDFPGRVVCIFQPGEEGYAGADKMIKDGLFERFPVDEVYGQHNTSTEKLGTFHFRKGYSMAAADGFSATIYGCGGHGSRPHQCIDPVPIAAQIVSALQTVVSRSVDPRETAVMSVCSLLAGSTRGTSVIPDSASITGTGRSFLPEVRDTLEEKFLSIVNAIGTGMGARVEAKYNRLYPSLYNHPAQTDCAADICASLVGAERVNRDYPAVMGSEDFSFMLQERPGCFLRIGTGDAEHTCGAHNPHFDFNDKAIPIGITLMARIATERLRALQG